MVGESRPLAPGGPQRRGSVEPLAKFGNKEERQGENEKQRREGTPAQAEKGTPPQKKAGRMPECLHEIRAHGHPHAPGSPVERGKDPWCDLQFRRGCLSPELFFRGIKPDALLQKIGAHTAQPLFRPVFHGHRPFASDRRSDREAVLPSSLAQRRPAAVKRYMWRGGRPGSGDSCHRVSSNSASASRIRIGYKVPDLRPV